MTTSARSEERLDGHGATVALGRRLALAFPPATSGVLLLSGHLGAGKTTLVKGLAAGLGVADADEVTSPTFLRVVRYDGPPDLVHVDAYRMTGAADVFELGLDEDLAGGRGPYAAAFSFEQALTVALLETTNLLADGRLRDEVL